MYHTIDQIRTANQLGKFHFFSTGAMRFFRSRIASHDVFAGKYFITSEQYENAITGTLEPRKYTIREALEGGNIRTVGEFQQYQTLREAKDAAKLLS